jgi:hypothetical protein
MNYSIKAGKFFPEFGLNLPNHNVPTRKGLFFNHNQEPHTIQGSYFTPTFDFTAAHIRGAKDTQFAKMAGLAGTVAYKRGSTRVGISEIYYNYLGGPQESMATSMFATVGYFSKGYTMFEGARKRVKNARKIKTDTNVGYLESGWEVYKGFIPYLNWEYTKNVTLKSRSHSPGLGVQLGLITHVELIAQYQRLYTPQGDGWAVYSMLNAYF